MRARDARDVIVRGDDRGRRRARRGDERGDDAEGGRRERDASARARDARRVVRCAAVGDWIVAASGTDARAVGTTLAEARASAEGGAARVEAIRDALRRVTTKETTTPFAVIAFDGVDEARIRGATQGRASGEVRARRARRARARARGRL